MTRFSATSLPQNEKCAQQIIAALGGANRVLRVPVAPGSPLPAPVAVVSPPASIQTAPDLLKTAEREFRFAPPRRWRFDYSWPEKKVALEVEGAVWTGGRHTRGAGFLKDMEKYNAAVMAGWRVVRCTPQTLNAPETQSMLNALLAPR